MNESPSSGATGPTPVRQLRRSRENKMIAGVCAGIADFAGIDATLVRIATVVLALCGGGGILAYLVAWAILPEEGTAGAPVAWALEGSREKLALIFGVTLVATGALVLLGSLTPLLRFAGPVALVALGVAFIAVGTRR